MRQTLMATLIVLMGLTSGCDKISPFVDDDVRASVCDRDGDGLMRSSEYCEGIDCDDNDNSVLDARGWFQDVDRDTFGAGEIEFHCIQPEGYQPEGGDCDDTEALVNPTATEVCNEVDDDCDGQTDEENILTWYLDADHDTYGNPDISQVVCTQPEGYVANNLDCNDTDVTISPDGTEICDDGIDQDCNGLDDDADGSQTWFADADMDSFGDSNVWLYSCEVEVEGYVLNDQDCDDTNLDIHPDASEACDDGVDNNCNGEIDTDAVDVEWYRDEDADGYGDENQVLLACSPPDGYVGNIGDCEDLLVNVNPEGTEVCNDGLDNDCDGTPNECELSGEILSTDADEIFTGSVNDDQFGSSSCSLDFNGDGVLDLVIGAIGVDTNASSSGTVYLFLGPVSGPLTASAADITINGPASSAFLGGALACSQDMTGDGVDDLVISAYNGSKVYILAGSNSLLGENDIDTVAAHILTEEGKLGIGLASVPDFDGDGLSDLLMGASEDDSSANNAGAVYLILSSDLAPGQQTVSTIAYATWLGEADSDALGESVSSLEDIDGDGLPDFLLGAPGDDTSANDAGAVYLVLSSSLTTGQQPVATAAFATYTGEAEDDALGTLVFDAGDTDGDNLSEMGATAPTSDTGGNNSGSTYLIASASLSSGVQDVAAASTTQLTGEGNDDRGGAGRFGIPGDLNGDGFSDLLVASQMNDASSYNGGSVYVFYGPLSGGVVSTADADVVVRGQTAYGEFGNFASFSEDLNGDGYDELLLSGHYLGSSSQGQALIIYGAGY